MRLLCVLAVIGAIVYLGWEKPLREWLPMNKPAEVARTGAGAPTPALAAANSDQLVLRQPTSVRLKYGSAILPAGLSLHIISKTSDAVVVDYAGEHVTIALH